MSRPSGLTLLTCALIVLLPALAILQYQWVGQVSVAERERMQRNLRNAALQFREAFDEEIARAFRNLQVGPTTARDGSSEQYSDRYNIWLDTAEHPKIVSAIFVLDADGQALRLRRWNPATHTFEISQWPSALDRWRPQFERDLADFNEGRRFERAFDLHDDALLVAPIRNVVVERGTVSRPRMLAIAQSFGFTIIELDLSYVSEHLLPSLAGRYFIHTDGDSYRVAVTASSDPTHVLYRSDPQAPIDPELADATESLFGPRAWPGFFFSRGTGPGGGDRRRTIGLAPSPPADLPDAGPERLRRRDDLARWRLLVQHQSGSLEAAVAKVRRRNLAISFGVLLLLTLSVALFAMSSRRAQRLARQQIEFVAGVSHELRTPVAVIRSAAENLSHGVVGSGDRVKRYGEVIESEARRLGEMVEHVLQYAGIESGLGLGEPAPVAPSEIIERAIESAVSMAGLDRVNVEREIAPDLPPVSGDAAALRSAVQNLIANALKYGGTDRWVGVRAERADGRPEVRIIVSDHGAGIPASELPHIFEPFYRGQEASVRQVHGNGLGLSLVRRIVAAHGGRVTVSTRPNAGTTFTISLPAATEDPHPGTIASHVTNALSIEH